MLPFFSPRIICRGPEKEHFLMSMVCSPGDPQGTVLSPFRFTLYTSDLMYLSFDTFRSSGGTGGGPRSSVTPLSIQRELVSKYKFLGVYLDNKIDWITNTTA